ncbi:hypothetical protein [Craterilacuibacter sinensis]|uniref:Uncharacterized protein n=1 Tax=Craterilacuibacter sinensis TaxID=2686017 RepID=A0A845BLB5_9NEIS|nr:hypothetical protein [Craterilacuibacter sinensis]MXR37457.1 hypothetical protein [Craterilacuibacter sinensis]
MANGVVADNWSLQEISSLLKNGFNSEPSEEIVVSDVGHSYKPVSSAAIQTEALFDLVTDIILRDEILVEEKFTNAWKVNGSPINQAMSAGVIRSYPFLDEPERLKEPRDRIVQHICSTKHLADAHKKNVEEWGKTKTTPDGLLSATLWGGAGMCARSFVYEKSYTPHPLRKRLFLNSGFLLPAQDALHQVTTFLDDNRVKVSKKIYGNDSLYSGCLKIPSLPVRVIQESSSASQIISIALEMRSDFKNLREWLKIFQNSMTLEDTQELIKKRKELDSVAEYVSNKIGLADEKSTSSLEVGIGIFKLSFGIGNQINHLKNQFGVRATLNRLIFGSSGKKELEKYVNMFDEKGSGIGYEVQRHFSGNS